MIVGSGDYPIWVNADWAKLLMAGRSRRSAGSGRQHENVYVFNAETIR